LPADTAVPHAPLPRPRVSRTNGTRRAYHKFAYVHTVRRTGEPLIRSKCSRFFGPRSYLWSSRLIRITIISVRYFKTKILYTYMLHTIEIENQVRNTCVLNVGAFKIWGVAEGNWKETTLGGGPRFKPITIYPMRIIELDRKLTVFFVLSNYQNFRENTYVRYSYIRL